MSGPAIYWPESPHGSGLVMKSLFKHSRLRLLLVCTMFLFGAALARAATLNVGTGQTYTTIQSAINAANNGDTVLVFPGTYYENIDFKGKAITVTSTSGPSGGTANTIIDGQHLANAVTFQSHEVRTSILSGFTVRNGGPGTQAGVVGGGPFGGIVAIEAAPSILNNIVMGSHCAGIISWYGAPLIQGNTVNTTDNTQGTCDFDEGSPLMLTGYTQYTNLPSTLVTSVIGNIVENNDMEADATTAESYAAGIGVENQAAFVQNNIIRNNKQAINGGGLVLDVDGQYQPVTIVSGNLIYGNTVACGAGGMTLGFFSPSTVSAPTLFISNNTIADNISGALCGASTDIPPLASQVTTFYDSNQTVFVNNIITSSSAALPVFNCASFGLNYIQYGVTGLDPFDHNDFFNGSGWAAVGSGCSSQDFSYNNVYIAAGTYSIPITATDTNHNTQTQVMTVVITQ